MLGVAHPGSMWHQYTSYLGDIFRFDFGVSLSEYPARVSTLLGETIPLDLDAGRHGNCNRLPGRHRLRIVAAWRSGAGSTGPCQP